MQYNFFPTTCQNVRRNLLAQFHVHKIRKKRRRPLTKKTATIWAETVLLLLLLPSWKTLLKRIFEIFFMFTSLSCLVRWPFFPTKLSDSVDKTNLYIFWSFISSIIPCQYLDKGRSVENPSVKTFWIFVESLLWSKPNNL